jgi:2-polyprenyl-3-methyl-5-hydroxy-6-metoxy-1,4-benzoquinol methylase
MGWVEAMKGNGDRYRSSSLLPAIRPGPASRYIHPKAMGLVHADSDHDLNLDVTDENAPNYLRWIADEIRRHLGPRVLEVGAGTGSITAQYADGREVLATDRSAWCAEEMRHRFATSPNVTVRCADLNALVNERERFDSVVMINVLEHIADDVDALQAVATLLEPDGRIIIYVPALNGLYGPWDRRVGHYRRYAPWRMRAILRESALVDVEMHYMNALSLPAWWVRSRTSVERDLAGGLSLWDKTGIRVSRGLESIVRVPVGLNLFCVAQPLLERSGRQ